MTADGVQMPESPVTALGEAAIALRELYVSLLAAGFERQEAIDIVAGVVRSGGSA